jgi:tetrahydromethanopterin S-methyltransferase subunit B
MIDVVDTRIKAFGKTPKADNVPIQEEPIFVLTSSQLQDVITKAIQPALERIESLEATITQQAEDMAGLEATVNTLSDNQLIQLRLIHELRTEKKVPGKTEMSRAEKIEKYLASRPDHRASFETLKGNLGVDKFRLNEAIKTLMDSSPGRYGITRTPGDKRKRTLIMLSK